MVLYFQSAPCSILAEVKEHEIVFNFKAVIKISHTSLSNWHQFYVPNIAVYFKDWICFQQIQSKRRNWHSFEALPHYHIHTHTLDQVSMQLLGCLLSNACGKLILAWNVRFGLHVISGKAVSANYLTWSTLVKRKLLESHVNTCTKWFELENSWHTILQRWWWFFFFFLFFFVHVLLELVLVVTYIYK